VARRLESAVALPSEFVLVGFVVEVIDQIVNERVVIQHGGIESTIWVDAHFIFRVASKYS
jgi:hypothetical protein